jgi:hypothetical protein
LRHGGLHGSTGSKGRDDCCEVRSDRNIAAIARTVRRGAASRGRISQARPQFGRPGEQCDHRPSASFAFRASEFADGRWWRGRIGRTRLHITSTTPLNSSYEGPLGSAALALFTNRDKKSSAEFCATAIPDIKAQIFSELIGIGAPPSYRDGSLTSSLALPALRCGDRMMPHLAAGFLLLSSLFFDGKMTGRR